MRGMVLMRCFELGNFGNGKLGNLFNVEKLLSLRNNLEIDAVRIGLFKRNFPISHFQNFEIDYFKGSLKLKENPRLHNNIRRFFRTSISAGKCHFIKWYQDQAPAVSGMPCV